MTSWARTETPTSTRAASTAIYGPGSQVISVFGQLLILGIGGMMYLHHPQEINLGQLTAFFLYVNRFFSPIQLLVQQYNTFQQGRASVFKLRGLLETEPSVLEAPDAVELPPIRGEIRFDHVSFGYDPTVPVLMDVDLTIDPGETVAFVGRDRSREVDDGQARDSLLRPHRGPGPHRRVRPQGA